MKVNFSQSQTFEILKDKLNFNYNLKVTGVAEPPKKYVALNDRIF